MSFRSVDLPLALGPRMATISRGARLEAAGFESEERGLRRIRRVGVADLLDAEAHFGGEHARRPWRSARRSLRAGRHARRLRRR